MSLLLEVTNYQYIFHVTVRMIFVISLLSMDKRKDINVTEKERHDCQDKLYFQGQGVSNASGSVVTCGTEMKSRAIN